MDLRQLENFLLVAHHANFSRAAAALYITQPAISRQIKELERELGTRLFYRTGRRLKLTSAGEILLSRANIIKNELETTVHLINEVKEGTTGPLRIAASPLALRFVVLPTISEIKRVLPEVDLQFIESEFSSVLLRVIEADAHLGIATVISGLQEELCAEELYRARMYAWVSPLHHLAFKPYVTIDDLNKECILILRTSRATEIALADAFGLVGFHPKSIFQSSIPDNLFLMAENDLGVAIVSDTMTVDGYKLRALPILYNGKPLESVSMVVWHRHRGLSPSGRKVADILKGYVDRIRARGHQRYVSVGSDWAALSNSEANSTCAFGKSGDSRAVVKRRAKENSSRS